MWYIAFLLFAQPQDEAPQIQCESSQVLLEADCAEHAYDKALQWARNYLVNSLAFELVGVEHLRQLGEEQPGDGTEIGGMFFQNGQVWEQRSELIPPKEELAAIVWERGGKPLNEMLSEEQVKNLLVAFGQEGSGNKEQPESFKNV